MLMMLFCMICDELGSELSFAYEEIKGLGLGTVILNVGLNA